MAGEPTYIVLGRRAHSSVFSKVRPWLPHFSGVIGPYIAASVTGEIQTMERFGSAKAVIACAGLDPKIEQSGKSLNATGRLTKRGSGYLRRSLFIAANIARRYDPQFGALYERKRAEGKTHKVATCVVARKLLTVIRAVWLSGEAYAAPAGREGKGWLTIQGLTSSMMPSQLDSGFKDRFP